MSLLRPLLNGYLRQIEKRRLARTTDVSHIRRRLAFQARYFFHAPRGTRQRWDTFTAGGRHVGALEVVPPELNSDAVIFYIHGGGFVFGNPRTHAAMLGHLAGLLGMRAVLPEYALAPESPYPAAVADIRTAWNGLIASGVRPSRIFVGGDSAGGALALGLLAELASSGAAQPGGVFCFSPLTDLTFSGESIRSNAKSEALLPAQRAHEMAQLYLAGQDAEDPRVSPLFANYKGAAPVWITVGDTEMLRDDARRMVARLKADKVQVTFVEQHDLPHVWPLFHNILPEARQCLNALAEWIRPQLDLPSEN